MLITVPDPLISYGHLSTLGLWLLTGGLGLGLLLVVGIVHLIFGRRWERAQTAPERRIPPIPMAAEFDSSLSPDERDRELLWIEELMALPAYGESTVEPGSGGKSEGTA